MIGNAPSRDRLAWDGVHLLRGLLVCGLVLAAGTAEGSVHASLRATLPALAGLGFGVALADLGRGGHPVSLAWWLHLLGTWLATYSPLVWGNREVIRTCAVAGAVALLLRRGGWAARLGVAGVMLVVAAWVASSTGPWWMRLGSVELLYGLGAAWPRGIEDVTRDVALFLVGCGAAGSAGISGIGRWRGMATPLRAIGRMPVTVVAGQWAMTSALTLADFGVSTTTWMRPVASDAALLAEIAFATWWIRRWERGPCEQVLHTGIRTLARLGTSLHGILFAWRAALQCRWRTSRLSA